jgi:uncharacterized membrane protein YuzA (DUF378 family)|uniref:DUF378 domain-containing protein n=1 Tax=viral metagenome TaxID=1070528 RepID=A0A6C0ALQ6_9ZZZZ
MNYSNIILMLVQILVIAGALNWGLVAFNGTDLVQQLTGGGDIEKYVKFAVAAAGIYLAYTIYV